MGARGARHNDMGQRNSIHGQLGDIAGTGAKVNVCWLFPSFSVDMCKHWPKGFFHIPLTQGHGPLANELAQSNEGCASTCAKLNEVNVLAKRGELGLEVAPCGVLLP